MCFFFQSDTPTPTPQEKSKCENVQFLQWILKDDDVYFKKNIILNLDLRELFCSEKYRLFTHAAVAIWRHSASMG